MSFKGESVDEQGVVERRFELEVAGRWVPGLLWTPSGASGPRPLVLLGHGGTSHKRSNYILAMGRMLARRNGFAAAAIDQQEHGERRSQTQNGPPGREQIRERLFNQQATQNAVEEWKAVVDWLQKQPDIGISSLGYWGWSMGTVFGIPFVASEPRVDAAVLGLAGSAVGRLMKHAPEVKCPVLFCWQLDDELMARETVLELFDALGSADKTLHANPGRHVGAPRRQYEATVEFLRAHLGSPIGVGVGAGIEA